MAEGTGENPGGVRANVTVDGQGWFKAVSPQFLAAIGRPVESLAGVNLVDLIHPNDVSRVRVMLAQPDASSPDSTAVRLFVAGDRWLPVEVLARSIENGRTLVEFVEFVELVEFVERTPEAIVEPAKPSEVDDEFPYADSAEHMAYVGLMPSDEVPELRTAVRASAGRGDTPMLEVDIDGHTVYVAGPWSTLAVGEATGAEVFEELLARSGKAGEIAQAMGAAIERAEPSRHELLVPGLPPRWVRILPIPSPHQAGVVHALIAVVPESELNEPVAVAAPTSTLAPVAFPATALSRDTDAGVARRDQSARREAPGAVTDKPSATPRADHERLSRWSALRRELAAENTSVALVPDVEMLAVAGRSATIPLVAGGVLTYVALQGLYLGPAYGWASPIQGLLDSQACLVQPLCDERVLELNHLAVLALIGAVTAVAVLFNRAGPRELITARPGAALPLASTSWRPTRDGPGAFTWGAVLALVVVIIQTVFADGVSTSAWLAASGLGAIAAWRSDRAANIALGSTMAALALALSCLFVPLGIGTVWLGENRLVGFLLLVVGMALFAYALILQRLSVSSFDRFDYIAMLGFSVLALVLGLLRHRSWRYAFIGDEWSFYQGALDGLRGDQPLDTFDIGGPNNYFTGLTFELQGAVMRVAGHDVWGWRLSALLPMVLSVAAMYAFTRWLSGRTAAIAAAAALATGHMLLSFSMIGYNNSQSLVAVSASFAALAWAHQRPSALRFFLLGSAVGSTFLVYAMARLALVPVGLLFLVLFRDDLAAIGRRLGWATLGGLAMAAPAFFSWENWEALLKATPVEAEDPVLASGGVGRQILENTLTGWLSFIGSTRNSHFIVGPHLDVISAVLMIIGLGYTIARARTDTVLRWFLIGGVTLWTAINAIQQYAELSNTRSFMIPLVYCVFIGVGAAAILPTLLERMATAMAPSRLALGSLAGLVLVLLALNQWHIGSHANHRQSLTEQAMLVQQFELTESVDGQGMQVHVGWPEQSNARLNMVLRAHDIAAERIVIVPDPGSINFDWLCRRTEPAMLVMHPGHSRAREWTAAMAACWATGISEITDPVGGPKLLRVANRAGEGEFRLPASQRVVIAAATADFIVEDAIDVAADGDGVGYALSRSEDEARIHRLDGGGSFVLAQRQPVDFDITSDGLFVVAGNGSDDRLVWYDGKGNIVHRYPGRDDFPVIGGVTVADDLLWISDTIGSRIISLDDQFDVVETRFAESLLIDPASLATGPDGSVWVFSARSGEIVLVDRDDRVALRLPGDVFDASRAPRLTSTAAGWLIRSVPGRPIVELVAPDGMIADSRGGTKRPIAAASRAGELIVVDPRWNDVPVIAVDTQWAPAERGRIAWGARSVSADALAVFDDPFIGDDLAAGGPIPTELVDTEAVSVGDRLVWRAIGTSVVGEVHAIAADGAGSGALVADVNGRVIKLDAEGAAQGVIGLGNASSAFVSDLASRDGQTWALDAGAGRIVRVDDDDTVSVLDADAEPLRNARGIGVGVDGSLWVASTAAGQLTNIAPSGNVIATIELPGRQPADVVQVGDAFWFVDAQDIELVQIDADGVVLQEVPLEAFTSLEAPHLAVVGSQLWVTEPELSAVFAIDLDTGAPTRDRFELSRPDTSLVTKPIGIAATADGRLWVVDSQAGGVLILEP